DLIAPRARRVSTLEAAARDLVDEVKAIHDTYGRLQREELSEEDSRRVRALMSRHSEIVAEKTQAELALKEITDMQAREQIIDNELRTVDHGAAVAQRPAYDRVARVGGETRVYRPDEDPRGNTFLTDVARSFLRLDYAAADRLARHQREEEVERGQYFQQRA